MVEEPGLATTLVRFAIVGLANTGLGLAVVLALQLGLGLDPRAANAVGYGAGFALGFALNRRLVFKGRHSAPGTLLRYALAALAAFLVNQMILGLALAVLGVGRWPSFWAQAGAVGCGTLAFFALCRWWVFRRGESPIPSAPPPQLAQPEFAAIRTQLNQQTNGEYHRFVRSLKPDYALVWRDIFVGYLALASVLALVGLPAGLLARLCGAFGGAVLVGYCIAYLQLFIHEAAHYNLHPDRRWNDRLGDAFVSWQVGTAVARYRVTHFSHHRELGRIGDSENSYFHALTPAFLVRTLTGLHALLVFISRSEQTGEGGLAPSSNHGPAPFWPVARGAGIHLVLLAAFLALGAWPAAVAWVLGMAIFYPFFATLRQILEHRSAAADPAADYSRTPHGACTRLFVDGPLAATFGAAGFSRHLLHHWEPQISYTQLPALEAFLEPTAAGEVMRACRGTYWTALTEIWRNDRR